MEKFYCPKLGKGMIELGDYSLLEDVGGNNAACCACIDFLKKMIHRDCKNAPVT